MMNGLKNKFDIGVSFCISAALDWRVCREVSCLALKLPEKGVGLNPFARHKSIRVALQLLVARRI
jgi:hypothetical protein